MEYDMVLRIKFAKYGPVKFIGHLDVMRYFQKAVRRAGIDVKYSNGFNPHQVMSFAAPLGVGLESRGEYFDLEMHSITSTEDIKKRLNAVMADGFEILRVKLLPEKSKNAMASVAAAEYEVRFAMPGEPGECNLEEGVRMLMNRSHVDYHKQTRKVDTHIDLRPAIYSLSADQTTGTIRMTVDASSAGNIKPGFVVDALLEQFGCTVNPLHVKVTRIDTYTCRDENAAVTLSNLIPLDDMGMDA